MLGAMRAIWLLCLLPSLLLGADPVAEQAAIIDKHERDPFEQKKRSRAMSALSRIGSVEAARVMEKLLNDPYLHIRDDAVYYLSRCGFKDPESLEFLCESLKKRREPETRFRLAHAIRRSQKKSAVPALIDAMRKERDPRVFEALAYALQQLPDESALGPLSRKSNLFPKGRAACIRAMGSLPAGVGYCLAHKDDKDDAVRAALVEVLARRKKPILPERDVDESVGVMEGIALAEALSRTKPPDLALRRAEGLLKHPSWRVRAAAIDGVVKMHAPELLGDLVERMKVEQGRLRFDAWRALRRMTGKDISPDPDLWRALLPMHTLPDKRPFQNEIEAPGGTSEYFGIPVVSERIAFVVDPSGSMRKGGKMELARERFLEMAKGLTKKQRYDVFIYRYPSDHPPKPYLDRCFGKLRSGSTKKAVKWLGRQEPKGWGALYEAMAAAIADDDVDTIYLLSDGRPSRGYVTHTKRVIEEIALINRWRQVRIHTILVGTKGTDRRFMANLARLGGGHAVGSDKKPLAERGSGAE